MHVWAFPCVRLVCTYTHMYVHTSLCMCMYRLVCAYMHMCIYRIVCAYMCIYRIVCGYFCMYIYLCVHMYRLVYRLVCVHTGLCVYVQACVCTYRLVCVHTGLCVYVQACVCTYRLVCAYTCIHTRTLTFTPTTPTRHNTETWGHYRCNRHSHTHQTTPLKGPENPSVYGMSKPCMHMYLHTYTNVHPQHTH